MITEEETATGPGPDDGWEFSFAADAETLLVFILLALCELPFLRVLSMLRAIAC